MGTYRQQKRCNRLLELPQELLQLVLKDVPGKYSLRTTCKALASALATSCDGVVLRRTGLLARGPRSELAAALAAFPNARRVVLDLQPSTYNSSSTTTPAPPPSDEGLLCGALSAMRGRGITCLALLHLSCPPPPPSALAHLLPSLLELELGDSSYARASEQGAFNLLVRERGEICARGDSLIQLAVSQPQLRRLSISSAAFSAGGVTALRALTRLESLSVVGCVECPGAAAQAAETHRSLLSLPLVRQLRLPMAVASPSTALLDDDDDDYNGGYGGYGVREQVDGTRGNGAYVLGGNGGRGAGSAAGVAGFFGEPLGADASDRGRRSGGSWRNSMHATLVGGPQVPADLPGHDRAAFPSAPMPYHTTAASLVPAGAAGLPAKQLVAAGPPRACPGKHATAAFAGLVGPPAQRHQQQSSQPAAGFTFSPHLQDLTIPLSTLNRPVFEAACAAYATSTDGEGCEPAALHGAGGASCSAAGHSGHVRTRICSSSPGAWTASGATRNCAARCSGCSGGCAPGGGRSALQGGSLRSLHIPTLAGYSHWEGSFLSSARDFQLLSRLGALEQLHLSLDVGAFRMSRVGMRGCFQSLLALRNLKELRISAAQQPTCFSVRKRSTGCHHPHAGGFGAGSGSELSRPALLRLQRQWPELRTLQFFSETVVRSGGRLVVPDGIDDVELLPPSCACCTVPYLMAAPPRNGGRWGRGDPRWAEVGPSVAKSD